MNKRQKEDYLTCPCVNCVKRCNKSDYVADCVPYQAWQTERWEKREWQFMMAEVTRNADRLDLD